MADRIVQLIDGRNNDNIYPVTTADAPVITVTSTDPGVGSVLAANHFVAVTGSATGYVGAADISSNAVTTAKIADSAVTADKINFATLGGNYSTTEQATNYTWIDGSMIYKKTINFGVLPSSTSKSVAHGITNLSDIIEMEGTTSNGTTTLQLPYAAPSSSDCIALYVNATNVNIATGTNRSAFTKTYVTLYYTKSA